MGRGSGEGGDGGGGGCCGCGDGGALTRTADGYAQVATMHGVYYVFERKYGRLSSAFWVVVCLVLISMGSWLTIRVRRKKKSQCRILYIRVHTQQVFFSNCRPT